MALISSIFVSSERSNDEIFINFLFDKLIFSSLVRFSDDSFFLANSSSVIFTLLDFFIRVFSGIFFRWCTIFPHLSQMRTGRYVCYSYFTWACNASIIRFYFRIFLFWVITFLFIPRITILSAFIGAMSTSCMSSLCIVSSSSSSSVTLSWWVKSVARALSCYCAL